MHQLLVTNLIDYYRNLNSKIAFSSLHFCHTSPEGKEDEIEILTIPSYPGVTIYDKKVIEELYFTQHSNNRKTLPGIS